jgi:SAM-dependent methyltransferase
MSLNRESGDEFYRKKAREHRDVLSDNDAQYGILDLGCGAGELLEQLAPLAKVAVGIDYSPAMLAAARRRLDGRFELERILDLFAANAKARTFYLFDCIDPMRYDLLVLGISYRPEHLAPDGFGRDISRSPLIRELSLPEPIGTVLRNLWVVCLYGGYITWQFGGHDDCGCGVWHSLEYFAHIRRCFA